MKTRIQSSLEEYSDTFEPIKLIMILESPKELQSFLQLFNNTRALSRVIANNPLPYDTFEMSKKELKIFTEDLCPTKIWHLLEDYLSILPKEEAL